MEELRKNPIRAFKILKLLKHKIHRSMRLAGLRSCSKKEGITLYGKIVTSHNSFLG